MSRVTATQFNQRPSEVKAMAEAEPVFITERGRTTAVLLSAADYARLFDPRRGRRTLLDVLGARRGDDDDLEIEPDRSLAVIPDLAD
jgi:prevent-host-death family protein